MSCHIRFVLELHDPDDVQLNNHNPPRVCNAKAQQEAYDQACRQKLRALLLVVKAKLEAVAAGISTLETGFLANIVLPDNTTAGDWMLPQIEQAYRTCCPPRDGSGTVPPVPFPSRRPEWFTRSWNGNVPVGLWQRRAGWRSFPQEHSPMTTPSASVEIYCFKCKAKTASKDIEAVTMKNGRPANRSTCVDCGTRKFRIGVLP